ncbi:MULTISPECIES: PIN domain-containing protein [Thiorhodovibrio]|uniref:PIN domain-containing protein n=1 Tax=Thiorhodovibrio TaxID=61593 RepID=UPI0019119809|nr:MULTISPECIES: PIN domain-containing protein [Thiorhodovibrio]MBK5969198.1 PIN domain protein [Thiorhodovibrio winogradskyi]WPL11189.1 hypothetical protein Thiosp_00917 [Thiorhodovibrio litoralis]
MRIYLDNCVFNRPFDTQQQIRIRLEAEAKLYIQQRIRDGSLELAWSYMLDLENEQNPFHERRMAIARWANLAVIDVVESPAIIAFAKQLAHLGVKPKDALHVASAVAGKAEYFVTTDDKLLKKLRDVPECHAITPIDFLVKIDDRND